MEATRSINMLENILLTQSLYIRSPIPNQSFSRKDHFEFHFFCYIMLCVHLWNQFHGINPLHNYILPINYYFIRSFYLCRSFNSCFMYVENICGDIFVHPATQYSASCPRYKLIDSSCSRISRLGSSFCSRDS